MNTKPKKKSPKAILSVRIPVELIQELDGFATQSNMERSTLVRLALQRGLPSIKKVAQFLSAE